MDPPLEDAVADELLVLLVVVGVYCVYSERVGGRQGEKKHDICRAMKASSSMVLWHTEGWSEGICFNSYINDLVSIM